jgi:hypothetical protein
VFSIDTWGDNTLFIGARTRDGVPSWKNAWYKEVEIHHTWTTDSCGYTFIRVVMRCFPSGKVRLIVKENRYGNTVVPEKEIPEDSKEELIDKIYTGFEFILKDLA